MAARNLRARVREEITEEIRSAARRRLAVDGADLSLRAVARDVDLVPSALYRYFPSRDALLTDLITEAYQALAQCAETAEAAVPRAHHRERWLVLCRAARGWALRHPAEYALIYGSPVPGYAAPPDTVAPASRVILALIGILFDAAAAGAPVAEAAGPLPPAVHADLHRLLTEWPGPTPASLPSAPERVLAIALTLWTQLFGLLGFEVFGRLEGMVEAREAYFDHQLTVLADLARLR
ncbi:TetR/AcrR family transcriptional regulator [Kitasatospora nipponensis]|uniref:TetR/AcrR family transcriptional regulator n=1 Tax=Kitasatospora nipponensis TaxID=258049 RepID=A0ABP4H0K2_9ACTN